MVLNDPFAGGTHLNDVTLVAPCHAGGRLVGWVANRAHHADVGGMAPGSIPPAATEIYQEGLRIPPVRLTPEVAALLRGQLAGARASGGATWRPRPAPTGSASQRLAALAGRLAEFDEVVAYGERRMRAALADLPDGTWTAEDVLDSTGPGPGAAASGGHPAAADHRGLRGHVRLQPAPRRSSAATSTPWPR